MGLSACNREGRSDGLNGFRFTKSVKIKILVPNQFLEESDAFGQNLESQDFI